MVDTEILALTPVLEGTCPVFHMNQDVGCGLCTDAFVGFRKCSIVPALRVFIMNGINLCQVLYLHLLRSSYFFLLYFVKVVSDTDFECEAGSPS